MIFHMIYFYYFMYFSADVGHYHHRGRLCTHSALVLRLYHQKMFLQKTQEEGRKERFERLDYYACFISLYFTSWPREGPVFCWKCWLCFHYGCTYLEHIFPMYAPNSKMVYSHFHGSFILGSLWIMGVSVLYGISYVMEINQMSHRSAPLSIRSTENNEFLGHFEPLQDCGDRLFSKWALVKWMNVTLM